MKNMAGSICPCCTCSVDRGDLPGLQAFLKECRCFDIIKIEVKTMDFSKTGGPFECLLQQTLGINDR